MSEINKNMVFVTDDKLTMYDFIGISNAIAIEYFDVDGNYYPAVGELNAMRLCWNQCIKSGKYDELGHDLQSIADMEILACDDDFIKEYNKLICSNKVELTFGMAYSCAMDMVNQKKSSLSNVVNTISKTFSDIMDRFSGVSSTENMDALKKIAGEISSGNLSADAIVEAYTKQIVKPKARKSKNK